MSLAAVHILIGGMSGADGGARFFGAVQAAKKDMGLQLLHKVKIPQKLRFRPYWRDQAVRGEQDTLIPGQGFDAVFRGPFQKKDSSKRTGRSRGDTGGSAPGKTVYKRKTVLNG